MAGSPVPRRGGSRAHQENSISPDDTMSSRADPANMLKRSATVLSSSKLANQAPKNIKVKLTAEPSTEASHVDKLLATLSQQKAVLQKQQDAMSVSTFLDGQQGFHPALAYGMGSSTSSLPITPATDTFGSSPSPASSGSSGDPPNRQDEVLRLKLELEQAKGQIAQMNQELVHNRFSRQTFEQTMDAASDTEPLLQTMSIPSSRMMVQQPFYPGPVPLGREKPGNLQDDAQSDCSDAMSTTGFGRTRNIWGNNTRACTNADVNQDMPSAPFASSTWIPRGYNQPFESTMAFPNTASLYRGERAADQDMMLAQTGGRRVGQGPRNPRGTTAFPFASAPYDGVNAATHFGAVASVVSTMPSGAAPVYSGPVGYQPQPIGTGLTAQAPEFTPSILSWKNDAIATEGPTYLPPTEPLNYRRLLDRSVNCNWRYIVDKIVCNNDQQASIFLQQKLKVGTPEQKYEIVEAIIARAYALMVNRFGNFLVQRCFEHGTPEQVIKIANAIRGNTLELSMDAFGCHVIQKAFDSVPEDYKAMMVHELLRRIPETVIHRYACHVWQKLFELRWTESPPQIMSAVNKALGGMWHEVALGETGSLVVQNIFENCLEEDKRPCIEEVLASIDIVAHGQFGNWCIQHICEHGAPADRSRAIDHVIRYATEYSMDQFASKVVEKCLKIGGTDFLSRYLDRVCEGRMDRPRIPLIDIASDQYGNYLIQYILTHSNPQHREIVAGHIRKHMVSLRGSKFGSRVGMLCTNPAVATRPGPGLGVNVGSVGTRMPQNNRYGGYR